MRTWCVLDLTLRCYGWRRHVLVTSKLKSLTVRTKPINNLILLLSPHAYISKGVTCSRGLSKMLNGTRSFVIEDCPTMGGIPKMAFADTVEIRRFKGTTIRGIRNVRRLTLANCPHLRSLGRTSADHVVIQKCPKLTT
jgi:hypothetical protein